MSSIKDAFLRFSSQFVVACLLALFVLIALIALFSTSGVGEDTEWLGMTVNRFGAQAPTAITRKWLGIEAEMFVAPQEGGLGIPAGVQGVLIDGVARGSPAERTGLAANDVIVSVNGRKVNTTAELWSTLASLYGADLVEFGIYRAGQLMSAAMPTGPGTLAGGFRGRMGGLGLGPGGQLVCPKCATRVIHQRGVACYSVRCPSCGTPMIRAQ